MSTIKKLNDNIIKFIYGKKSVPLGLSEMNKYFYHNGPINFDIKNEDGVFIAISKDYRLGSIIAEAKNMNELDENIKDAILTSFEIPSSYMKEAAINKVGDNQKSYAIA